MNTPTSFKNNRAHRRVQKSNKVHRLGYRIAEWSEITGTSRVTTWRNIRSGALRTVDYNGITLIPSSEAVRLQLQDA
jgi:hypothetical protein